MALVSKDSLVNSFKNGKKPNEEEFANLIDSCYGYLGAVGFSENSNVLQFTTPDASNGSLKVINVDIKKLDQVIQYNAVTNELSISGHTNLPQKMGYWGPNSGSYNSVAQITTDAKVGINVETPSADLHVLGSVRVQKPSRRPLGYPGADLNVDGSIRLESGVSANEIVASAENSNKEESAIPTVSAVRKMVNNLAELLLFAQLDTSQLPPTSNPRMLSVESVNNSNAKVKLQFIPLFPSGMRWENLVLSPGIYRIDLNLYVRNSRHGEGTGVLLEVDGIPEYFWRTSTAEAGRGKILSHSSNVYVINETSSVGVFVVAENNGKVEVSSEHGVWPRLTITRLGSGRGDYLL